MFYKSWFQSGIKYVKDIYDHETKTNHSFRKMQDTFDLPNTDYLRYLSLINSIQKEWKRKLNHENTNIPAETKILDQHKNTAHTNIFIYNCILNSNQMNEIKSLFHQQVFFILSVLSVFLL